MKTRTNGVGVRFLVLLMMVPAGGISAQVTGHQKLAHVQGGMGPLGNGDWFGISIDALGDRDADGTPDLVVGARGDDDGGFERGAVYLLFLHPDGTIGSRVKISDTSGGFAGGLSNGDLFGMSVASLGDLNGDGFDDIAVGAPLDDTGGTGRGAVWVLFLGVNGTVIGHQKIASGVGGFTASLADGDEFGFSLEALGDLDADGVTDLAVGSIFDDGAATNTGAVWILFLNADGTVKAHQKIDEVNGGFGGDLDDEDRFGFDLAALDDMDGDGIGELAVGAILDSDGNDFAGAVWILFLNADGTVASETKLSQTSGGLAPGTLDVHDHFGSGLDSPGDLDGDGVPDLSVGANGDDDGLDPSAAQPGELGAIYNLFLNADGSIKDQKKISQTVGGFTGDLDDQDVLGNAVAWVGDIDADGFPDLAMGAIGDDDGGPQRGAVWVTFLRAGVEADFVIRNGSDINPLCYFSLEVPLIGGPWSTQVGYAPSTLFTATTGYSAPLAGLALPMGELLVHPGSTKFYLDARIAGGAGINVHSIFIPNDTSLLGLTIYSQAAVYDGGLSLCNAVDATIGCQ